MANSFLDKFQSGLRALQARQILILISKEKDRGEITTVEEFKSRLSYLTSKLSNSTLTPTIELFLAKNGDIIDSTSFNSMLERIEDDLKAAFQEANDIEEVLDAHETIINDVVIRNLELAINELESKINALDFLSQTSEGFDSAIYNTFRISQNARSFIDEGVIFLDPKTGLQAGSSNDASIDIIGEKLLLGGITSNISPAGIYQIFDVEAPSGELQVDGNSSILSAIDNTIGTFWSHSSMFSQPLASGLLTKVELDLGTVQTVNNIEIVPILSFPVEVYRIVYLDQNNQYQNILTEPRSLNTLNKLFFQNIAAKKIQIVFRNQNYTETQFELTNTNSLVQVDNLVENRRVSAVIDTALKSQSLLNREASTQLSSFKKYYQYSFGLDEIKVGLQSFQETSFFISPTEKRTKCFKAAVKLVDKRPFGYPTIEYTEDTNPSALDTLFHASSETYLIKRDYSKEGTLLEQNTIPVLPLNTSQIRQERLLLNTKSNNLSTIYDIGYLQFYTSENINQIKVYRNGFLLTQTDGVTINPFESDGWFLQESSSNRSPNAEQRMRIAIRIQRPNPNDIYSVSYTPDLGFSTASNIEYLIDLTGKGRAWLTQNNIINFPLTKAGSEIDHSLLNLVIVLRRNSSNAALSPVIEEYVLATNSKVDTKYV